MPSRSLQKAAFYVAFATAAVAAGADIASADTKPVSAKQDINRLSPDAARLYAEATLIPRALKYQEIPWLLDLQEGIRQAKKEKRPLLIWTSGDDPLERC